MAPSGAGGTGKRMPSFGGGWFLRRLLARRRWSGCPAVLDHWYGRCRSDLAPSSSGDGRSPSPCRGAGQSGTAEPFTRFCEGSRVKGGSLADRRRPRRRPSRRSLPGTQGREACPALPTDGLRLLGASPGPGPESLPNGGPSLRCGKRNGGRRKTVRWDGCQPGEFAPFGEGHDLAALYRSRQARYLRADYDKDLTRRRDRAELDPALEASGVPFLPGHSAVEVSSSAPGASVITPAILPIQLNFVVPAEKTTRLCVCSGQASVFDRGMRTL